MKCIPGISGSNDLAVEAIVVVGGVSVAKVDKTHAYHVEPMAPVSSVIDPMAPNRAPDWLGGTRFANSACNAGTATDKTEKMKKKK